MYAIIIEQKDDALHYGTKRHSGRYPYGSGERPFQSEATKKEYTNAIKGKDRSGLMRARTIKAGTTMYRTTNKTEDPSGPMYVTYLQPDRAYYRSVIFVQDLAKREKLDLKKDSIYEKQYKLKEDLRIPSRAETYQAKYRVLGDSLKREKIVDEWVHNKILSIKDKKISDFSDEELKEYNKYSQAANFGLNSDIRTMISTVDKLTSSKTFQKELANDLSQKGYNAIVDELGVGGKYALREGGRREGVDPLIIFDSNLLEKEFIDKIDEGSLRKYTDITVSDEEKRNRYDRRNVGNWSDDAGEIL